MEKIAISKFKATCLSLLERVKRSGQPILVTKHGEPVALVTPPPAGEASSNWLGSFRHSGRITGDVVAPAADPDEWEALR